MGGGIQVPPIKQVIELEHSELRELRTQDDLLLNMKSFGSLIELVMTPEKEGSLEPTFF